MNIEVKISKKKINYEKAMKILENRVKKVINGEKPELLWILEHNTIYTGGTNYKENEILNKNIKVFKTNRGGKITCHGPGQKVVYFVLNLNKRKKDIRILINKIENCIIKTLKSYQIKSFPDKKNIGIWVNNKGKVKKIAAIGIRVKKWIAYHGFSINISNDLSVYRNIIPCGIIDKTVTNLVSLKKKNFKGINKTIIRNFKFYFK
tara:strand:+ start:1724 stop:2341 length:618 start_codon:yes stop_codon:yes gene_type:complete